MNGLTSDSPPVRGAEPLAGRVSRNHAAQVLALIVLVLLFHGYATTGDFIWEDNYYIFENEFIGDLDGLRRICFDVGATPQYYPLTYGSFWVEYHLWGANPIGYHVVNAALHALSAVLLWLVLRRVGIAGAWLAAALFAVHPVNVESVAWATERKNVLSGFFYLLSMLAYLRFLGWAPGRLPTAEALPGRGNAGEARGHTGWYVTAFLLFVAAMLSKSVVVTMPFALLLLIWFRYGRVRWADAVFVLPFALTGVLLGLQTAWLEKTTVGATGTDWSLTPIQRCLIAGRAVWFYAGKLLWPYPLVFIYPKWAIDARSWPQYLYPAGVALALAAAWFARRRIGRGPVAAFLFFIGTLGPALGFVDVFPMRFTYVADHFQYHASAGLLALFAASLTRAAERWGLRAKIRTILAAGLLGGLGVLALEQGLIYRDLETLYRDTLLKNPGAWLAHHNLALVLRYYRTGRLEEALAHCREAARLKPDDPTIRYNLGEMLSQRGDLEEARSQYEEAIRLDPLYGKALIGLGGLLDLRGKMDEALRCYRRAARVAPRDSEARLCLGTALAQERQYEEAIQELEEAARLSPASLRIQHNLWVARAQWAKDAPAVRASETSRPNPD